MPTLSPTTQSTQTAADAARSLVAGQPHDQALGLRLIALAQAAAGVHMAQTIQSTMSDLGSSQAARLVREARA